MKTTFLTTLLLAALTCGSLHAAGSEEALQALAKYNYGDSRQPLLDLQAYMAKADPAARAGLEKQFIALLEKPDVPTGAKDAICRMLVMIGTPASIPALEKFSADPQAGFLAVYALMVYPPEANAALLRLLDKSSTNIRTEVIGALGRRGAVEAVPALAKINEPAAWTALAAIGSPDAVEALQKATAKDNLTLDWARANGALNLARKNPSSQALAATVFKSLLSSPARIAAVEGLIQLNDPEALPTVRKLLQNGDLAAAPLAVHFASEAWDLAAWKPEVQQAVVLAFGQDRNPAAIPFLQKALGSSNADVRLAAIETLGRAGDATVVPLLLPLLANEKDATAAAASLQRIPGDETAAQLREAFASAQGPAQILLLGVLAQRLDRNVLPAVFTATQSPDDKVRSAAFQALSLLATPADLPKFLALLPGIKAPADRAAWGKTLQIMVQNTSDANAAATLLDEAFAKSTPESRPALIMALASLPSDQAAASLEKTLQSDDLEQRKAIIRTLSGVRTISSGDLLFKAARQAKDPSERMLALRGYLDVLRTRNDLSPDDAFLAYQAALALAVEQSEKEAIYAGIKAIKNSKKATAFLKQLPAGA